MYLELQVLVFLSMLQCLLCPQRGGRVTHIFFFNMQLGNTGGKSSASSSSLAVSFGLRLLWSSSLPPS